MGVGGTEEPEKFFGRAPPLFGSKSTIHRFGERFRDGQYSLVSFLFAVFPLTVPRAQSFVKLGGGGARAPVPHGVGALCAYVLPLYLCAHVLFVVSPCICLVRWKRYKYKTV